MLWLDVKYAKEISPRLERFKIKKETPNFLSQCRCPLCGDSQSSQKKARGYFYTDKGELHYKCFNCGFSSSFSFFLKTFDINLYNMYKMEKFISPKSPSYEEKVEKVVEILKKQVSVNGQSVINTEAEQYLLKRKIPRHVWDRFFYVPEFFKWTKTHTDKFEKATDVDHPRLVMPWRNSIGNVFAYQARSLHNEQPKYYTVVLNKDEPNKIYGLDQIDFTSRIYVVEGPIDSLFLPNCVAVGSSALYKFRDDDLDVVYIPDADYRNKEIVKIIEKMIDENLTVCLLPHDLGCTPGKDINDYIMGGMTQKEVLEVIENNTFSGLELKLVFPFWRRA